MKHISKIILAACLVLIANPASLEAIVLHDNGSVSGYQTNTRSGERQRVYDEFTLLSDSTITDIFWQQFDAISGNYEGTLISIFSGFPESMPLFSTSSAANRTLNSQGVIFGNWEGYDYSLSGLNITLEAGTYWLGIGSSGGFDSSWADTVDATGTLQGSRVYTDFFSDGLTRGEHKAFRLEGRLTDSVPAASVPDSGSTALLAGFGFISLLAFASRRRASR